MKKIILVFSCCLVCLNIIVSINFTDNLFFDKIETFANCESPVNTERGPELKLECRNSDGSRYVIRCCDADPNYTEYEYCTGRKCSD